MTMPDLNTTTDAAFRPDPAAGAAYARGSIESAAKTISGEAKQHPTDRSPAAVGTALANAARWYDALCRHDLATIDDHAKMDELRITAARAAGEATPQKAEQSQGEDWLKLGAAAVGGFILGDTLGD